MLVIFTSSCNAFNRSLKNDVVDISKNFFGKNYTIKVNDAGNRFEVLNILGKRNKKIFPYYFLCKTDVYSVSLDLVKKCLEDKRLSGELNCTIKVLKDVFKDKVDSIDNKTGDTLNLPSLKEKINLFDWKEAMCDCQCAYRPFLIGSARYKYHTTFPDIERKFIDFDPSYTGVQVVDDNGQVVNNGVRVVGDIEINC